MESSTLPRTQALASPRADTPLEGDALDAAVESVALHVLAVEYWNEHTRDLMLAAREPGGFERWTAAITVKRAVERAAARAIQVSGLPAFAFPEVPDLESLTGSLKNLPEALELVTAVYQRSLPQVKNCGLLDASTLDVARKAVQAEIKQAS